MGVTSGFPRFFSLLLLGFFCFMVMGAASCVPTRGVDESKPLTASVKLGIEKGTERFSHLTFDSLLKAHVKRSGRVDYAGLEADHAKLKKYLGELAAAPVAKLSRDELLALLINAYNAYTLDLIVRNYPLKSIQDLKDPWDTPFCELGGEKITLNDIEHKYLRPVELFDDPRMHFAINCASIGCPLLRPEAYTGKRIHDQLDSSTRTALRDDRYLRVDGETIFLSNILNWFKDDFVKKSGSLAAFLKPYVREEAQKILAREGGGAIRYLDYDWNLNDVEK